MSRGRGITDGRGQGSPSMHGPFATSNQAGGHGSPGKKAMPFSKSSNHTGKGSFNKNPTSHYDQNRGSK